MKVKLPFEPSWPAQIAAMAALEDHAYIDKTVESCHKGMKQMEMAFNEMNIKFILSAANFLTLVFNDAKEAESFNHAMLHKGIILRYLDGWGLPECVRVTIGTDEENEYLIESLSEILSNA